MVARLKWNGKQFGVWSHDKLFKGLRAAGFELHRIAQLYASIPNPGVRKKRKRRRFVAVPGEKGTFTRQGRTYTVYPHSSEPDESPRMRTGFGRRNIVWNASRTKMHARVGYTRDARYMIYHELGITYRRAGWQQRPTIVPALEENKERLSGIMERASTR